MEQNRTVETTTGRSAKSENKRFTIASILRNDGRWRVLGITIEAWVVAFLIALALPYVNIVAIPIMFFVFAGALAVYSVWALFRLVYRRDYGISN